MGVLEDYEERCGLVPLTTEEILDVVELSERCLKNGILAGSGTCTRVIVWLSERVMSMAAALGDPSGTMACGWCWRAAGLSQEIWRELPKFTLADAQAHAQVCEHNPLVLRIRELEAQLEDCRGRPAGIDNLRDGIRVLLRSEVPSGELRRALGELVR